MNGGGQGSNVEQEERLVHSLSFRAAHELGFVTAERMAGLRLVSQRPSPPLVLPFSHS